VAKASLATSTVAGHVWYITVPSLSFFSNATLMFSGRGGGFYGRLPTPARSLNPSSMSSGLSVNVAVWVASRHAQAAHRPAPLPQICTRPVR
jgi:hypothetical protein